MSVDLTINTGKGIKITTGQGGIFYIRNGNLKNFFADAVHSQYYFNYQEGSDLKYDWLLKWADIGTYNGSTTIPPYGVLAQAILTELDAEF